MKSGKAQKLLIGILAVITILFAFLFNKANTMQQELENKQLVLEDSLKRIKNELAFSNLRNEVIKELNSNLSAQIYAEHNTHVLTKTKEVTPEAKEVQSMIVELEQGWTKMMETKKSDILLNFFLDQYTTNSVKIDTDNMPFVQRHNNTDFQTHLNQLIATKDLSLSFDQPIFYSTMVRGNIFTTNYLSRLTATHEGKVIHKSTILCFVSGQKKNGKWKVGNYNWTRYDDFDASKNHQELML